MPLREAFRSLELMFEQNQDRYHVRVLSSPVGQAEGEFRSPFSDNDLISLNHPSPVNSPKRLSPVLVGTMLFEALFADQVGQCLRRSLDQIQPGQCLRIVFRLDGAPALAALPWECLYDPLPGRFLALSERTSIVRYLALPEAEPTLEVNLPLRVLVVLSNPKDMDPPLDVLAEQHRIQAALGDLQQRGQVMLIQQPATWSALQTCLRRETVHVLHFVGHGFLDPDTDEGMLVFEDEQGRARPITAAHLGTLIHNHRSLRLVLLNACESAAAAPTNPYAGIAQTMIRQGVPSVISMQRAISDGAARTFGETFFAALADGSSLDAALTQGRMAIYAEDIYAEDVGEMAVPVFFTRARDGHLFQPMPTPAHRETPARPPHFQIGSIQAGIVNQGGEQNFTGDLSFNLAFGEQSKEQPQPRSHPERLAQNQPIEDLNSVRRHILSLSGLDEEAQAELGASLTRLQRIVSALPPLQSNQRDLAKRLFAVIEEVTTMADAEMFEILAESLRRSARRFSPDEPALLQEIESFLAAMARIPR